jgi:hypothetical protein
MQIQKTIEHGLEYSNPLGCGKMNQNQFINEIQKRKYLKKIEGTLQAGIDKGQIGMTIGALIQEFLEDAKLE